MALNPSPDRNTEKHDESNLDKTRDTTTSLFGIKLSTALSKLDLENCEPELVFNLLRNPTIKIFSSLNRKLKTADVEWMSSFMDLGGFEVLFDLVESLSAQRVTQMSDAMLLLENVACVKTIMNSRIGMDYFINHIESGRKLVKALDTNNVMVKKHILELFSAITAYSTLGYHMTLDSLENYKLSKKKRYRFSVILNEIQMNKNLPSYWTTLLGLINCIVLATEDLYDRVQIRNEFIGLRLLEILDELREYSDEELLIQCDVFFEEMHADDEELANLRPDRIDINNHRQVFDTIFQQICDKPQASSFLNILQCLMHIENDTNSETQWLMVEDLVRKCVHMDKRSLNSSRLESDQRLLNCSRSEIDISIENYNHPVTYNPYTIDNSQFSESFSSHPTSSGYVTSSFTSSQTSTESSCSPDVTVEAETLTMYKSMTYPLSLESTAATFTAADMPSVLVTPKPKSIMKTLNWSKISCKSATKKKVVWCDILDMPDPVPINYDQLEGLFANSNQSAASNQSGPNTQLSLVSLMDVKRSMHVNIVLKMFKGCDNDNIIQMIQKGDEKEIGTERIKALIKVLPEGEELEMLTIYEGDTKHLNSAEQFCMQLIKIPEYSLSLEVMLLKCEFGLIYTSVIPLLKDITKACRALMSNQSLKEFLRFVLHTGNFINAGGYIGGALGFKISSLPKLMEIRSNKPKMTLLHYLVEELEKDNRHVMEFVAELSPLMEKTYWLSLPGLKAEIDILCRRVTTTEEHLKQGTDELKKRPATFLQLTKADVTTMLNMLNETYEVKDQLANHFCEEVSTFRLDQCLETYKNLCDNIKKCKKENVQRLLQEEQSKKKKKSTENKTDKLNGREEDGSILDKLLKNIKHGTSLRRIKKSCI